jgi:phosphoglycerate dehydrogenase-like enzyme
VRSRAEPDRRRPPFAHLLFLGFEPGDVSGASWDRIDAVSGRRTLLAEDAPELASALASADGLLLKPWLGADRALIDAAPGLRYIGMLGTGIGRIDGRHAASKGIAIRNVAGYSTRGVSEFVLAVVLAHLRDLERARSEVRAGRLSETGFAGSEIAGRTFGILGLGRIGLVVAGLARAFGAEAIYWSRASRADEPGIELVDRQGLFERADILSVHLAHAPETEGILDEAAFAAMRPGAVVVNAAPMDLVSLPALERKLATRSFTFILDHPGGLAPADLARLSRRPNCVVYPSLGYTTAEASVAKEEIFVRAIEDHGGAAAGPAA